MMALSIIKTHSAARKNNTTFSRSRPRPNPYAPRDLCGCGNGRNFGECCEGKPVELRPSWTERSIRERNLMFLNALDNVLGLADEG